MIVGTGSFWVEDRSLGCLVALPPSPPPRLLYFISFESMPNYISVIPEQHPFKSHHAEWWWQLQAGAIALLGCRLQAFIGLLETVSQETSLHLTPVSLWTPNVKWIEDVATLRAVFLAAADEFICCSDATNKEDIYIRKVQLPTWLQRHCQESQLE